LKQIVDPDRSKYFIAMRIWSGGEAADPGAADEAVGGFVLERRVPCQKLAAGLPLASGARWPPAWITMLKTTARPRKLI
jgi:hypothetical protein